MYNLQDCTEIKELIIPAMVSEDLTLLDKNINILKDKYRLSFSMLYDSFREARSIISSSNTQNRENILSKIIEAININIDSLLLWEQTTNHTVRALETDMIEPALIKPHIRFPTSEYDKFYSKQSEKNKQKLKNENRWSFSRFFNPSKNSPKLINLFKQQTTAFNLDLGSNINHSFRIPHAVHLLEVIFGLLAIKDQNKVIRWLDIGCGTGEIANTVEPRRYGCQHWDIVGCDMQEGKIQVANKFKSYRRHFFQQEAFALLSDMSKKDDFYDIISMFEFLEHLDDPLSFIERLAKFKSELIVIATPLAQNINKPFIKHPDPVHLWSFSRRGLERMLELADLEVIYSSEIRIGHYIGGLDWLTIICGNQSFFKENRTTWKNFKNQISQ